LCFQRAFEAVVWNMSYLFSDGSRVCDFSELLEEIYAPTIKLFSFVKCTLDGQANIHRSSSSVFFLGVDSTVGFLYLDFSQLWI
jgi:hypothetical protein